MELELAPFYFFMSSKAHNEARAMMAAKIPAAHQGNPEGDDGTSADEIT